MCDAADTLLDGGGGTDTLRVDSGNADLTAFAGTLSGILMRAAASILGFSPGFD